MLKFTPLFDPHINIINKKPQTYHTNFPDIKHITTTNNNANFPKVTIANKPFRISSLMKDNADSIWKATPVSKDVSHSVLTNEKKLDAASFAFQLLLSAVKWVISSVNKLVLSQRGSLEYEFIVENDLIKLEDNGREILGVVQHGVHHRDGLTETTLLSEDGLETFKTRASAIVNITYRYEECTETMWGIHTRVKCEDDDMERMVEEIKDVLNAHEDVKGNSKYNLVVVDSLNPADKVIIVMSFVTCSKLKTPRFEHYMEVRRNLLSEIDEIQGKHGCKLESSL